MKRIPKDSPRNAAAFSTVEVMVAVLICGLVFVGLHSGIGSGFSVVQLARENLRGTQILEEKLETIRLYRWDQINDTSFIPTNFVEEFYPAGTQSTSGLSYTGTVTIIEAPITEFYKDSLRQVTVGLQWKSGNVLRKREMTTFVSEYGLQHYIYRQ